MLFNVDFRFAPNEVIEAVIGEISEGPIDGVAPSRSRSKVYEQAGPEFQAAEA